MELSLLHVFVALCCVFRCNGLPIDSNYNSTQPLTHMSTCQIIQHYGYVCETHYATTQDGYILELHRIPHGIDSNSSTKGVAFVQHGLIDSSFTWIANTPNQSLGYILADRGYDVWLGNSRGNTYSRRHVRLNTDDIAYWEFSFDEMAKFDNPAAIDYILKLTGEKQVNYIGHSQGTMIGFAGFSTIPSLARKIKLFIALAPVTHIFHIKGLLKVLSSGTWIAKKMIALLGVKNFMPNGWVVKKVSSLLCQGITSELCKAVIFLITGFDDENLINDRLTLYTAHTPAGTSVKDIIHFSQLVQQDKFQMYDYGWNGNMHKYLQPTPPEYDMNKMKVPVALFVGQNDWLATEQDITMNLRGKLPNLIFDQDIDDWNHMDFVWGAHANEILYDNVVTLLDGKQPFSYANRGNPNYS